MPDPRISKLTKVLVHYSVEVQQGQQVLIRTNPIADELTHAVYEEIVKAGAHPFITNEVLIGEQKRIGPALGYAVRHV